LVRAIAPAAVRAYDSAFLFERICVGQILAIGIGGALGSIARFAMSTWLYSVLGRNFPYGTFIVNVSGCMAIGFLFVLFMDIFSNNTVLRAGVLIGLLGGYTTFSSFSIETFNLIEQGEPLKALIYALGSMIVGLFGTWVGVLLGRTL
jgi:CrcB protein